MAIFAVLGRLQAATGVIWRSELKPDRPAISVVLLSELFRSGESVAYYRSSTSRQ